MAANPFQIIIKDEKNSEYITNHIMEKASKLKQFSNDIIQCRISVNSPHQNQQHGNLHAVHIKLKVPRNEIVINKVEHKNVYRAIHQALDAACQQLASLNKRRLVRRKHNLGQLSTKN